MSHFAVLVVGDDPEKQLEPFHEFECTGIDNKYVKDIDITEKAREEYEKSKKTMLKFPDGSMASAFEDRFYRKTKTESGWDSKERFVPSGAEEIEFLTSESKSFSEFVKDYYGYKSIVNQSDIDLTDTHKYGYQRVDNNGQVLQVIDRTNPNKKWDWYSIGGRWTGFFKLKKNSRGTVGEPGLMTDPAKPGWCDQARKCDIDFEAMRDNHEKETIEKYYEFQKIVAGRQVPSWQEIMTRHGEGNIAAAREEFWGNQVMKDLQTSRNYSLVEKPELYNVSESDFRQRAREKAIICFAFLKDGQWHERGEMGWFGCVFGEKETKSWESEFNEMLIGLPDDVMLTVVDCHI